MLSNTFRFTYKRKVFLYDGECFRLLAAREHVQFLGEAVNCKPECDLKVRILKKNCETKYLHFRCFFVLWLKTLIVYVRALKTPLALKCHGWLRCVKMG